MDPRYLVAAALLLGLIGAFAYLFLRKRRLPDAPVPAEWHAILGKRVRYYRELPPERQAAFAKRVQAFLDDVQINGAATEVTLTDRLLVAASAEIPLFGFPDWRYPNLDEVILHGESFSEDFDPEAAERTILGLVGNRELSRAMVLSKPALHEGFGRNTEHNTGVHEFTHLIDMSDGATDGSPDYYLDDSLSGPWMRLVHREMRKIGEGDSDLREYAATNEAEFFAVASEYFFNRPAELEKDHPRLFVMLERIFKQDPTEASPAEAFTAQLPPEEADDMARASDVQVT